MAKLVRRHPHMFGDVTVSSADRDYKPPGVRDACRSARAALDVNASAAGTWLWHVSLAVSVVAVLGLAAPASAGPAIPGFEGERSQ